ncbi:hypothetical protein LHJ50_02445 [Enterococcus faecium]|uniref:hypothetical protein n=1 Tax=Enterococcus faecium TaxID=1352 RepID=UPI000282701F|nr:hypothetical protein [Enterococcus faecium]EJY41767.1 hypothetical protein HMPREF1350_01389 [Enterococcus faecium 509]MCB4530365.1 hypothetical protein [Enterococcus faecium]MCI1153578.1 hypothetical protein [Enterococcus faecium]
MNDKPKEKVYAERLDSSKKIGKRLRKKQSKTTKKKTLKQKKTKNSNLRKKRIYFNIFLQMPNEKQKGGDKNIVITRFLSKIVIKNWLLLWQD